MRPSTRMPPIPEQIIDAFRAIAPTVEAFARGNDMVIDRYRRGKAAWELNLAPGKGGQATLTISYRERTGHVLDVSGVWWVDDRLTLTRRLRAEKIGVYDRRAAAASLRSLLEAGLSAIDGWTEADLGPPRGPYKDWPATGAGEHPLAPR